MPKSHSLLDISPTINADPARGPNFQTGFEEAVQDLPGAEDARKAMQMIMESKTQWSLQHDENELAYKFYAGDQWSEEDKTYLGEEDRIPVVFNYVANHIDVIAGSEIHNRQDVRFVPRNLDPDSLAQISSLGELETSSVEWVLDTCDGYDEISLAFKDLLICGRGFTETYTDTEIDKDVRILVRRINPNEMMTDARAVQQNGEDKRFIARIRLIPLEEAIQMFPEKEDVLRALEHHQEGLMLDQQPERIEEYTPLMYEPGRVTTSPGEVNSKKGMVIVVQYQHWKLEDKYIVPDPMTGKEEELTEDEWKTLTKRLKSKPEHRKQTRKIYYQQFIAGNILPLTEDEPLDVQAGGFTFKEMTGKWDQSEKVYRGHLYQLMDPQRYANKYLSQTIHIINSNPKGGVLAEANVFKDPVAVERDWARPNSIILVEKDALANKRVEVKPITHLPDSTFQMWQHCIEAITGVSGVNPEILGTSKGDLPAMTMRQRQVQGMQVNAFYFAALTRYRRGLARNLLEFVREFISDGRMVRIGGQFNAKALPLLRESIAPEYNVVVDEAIRSPNAKAEVFTALTPLLPTIIRMGLLIPELFDLVPGMPASLAAKMKEKAGAGPIQPNTPKRGGQGAQGKAPENPQLVEAKVQKLQADVQMVNAKIAEIQARARAVEKMAQVKEMTAQSDMHGKLRKSQIDMATMESKERREAALHQVELMHSATKMAKDALQPGRQKTSEAGYDEFQGPR